MAVGVAKILFKTMDDIKRILQKLKPLYSLSEQAKLDNIWTLYQTSDWKRKKEIEVTINKIAAKHNLDQVDEGIILPPPSELNSKGDVSLGKVTYLDKQLFEFKVKLPELTKHAGIFGSTGTGKTTLARHVIKNLAENKIPFMIFDWESSYRGLIKEIPDIKIFTIGKDISPFRFNFFKVPPGITYKEYVKNVIEVFSKAYVGGVGSDTILLRVFDHAFQTKSLPTLEQVRTILAGDMTAKKMRGRSMLWKESAGRMIEFMIYGGTGDMYNTDKTMDLESLFNERVIFELGGLSNSHDKRFFTEILTLWYWLYVEQRGIEDENLKHVLLFEEFHNIVENSEKEDFIHKAFRQLRKYGTGIFALDQTPSQIPNSIYENMGTKVTFSLDHMANVRAVTSAMYMDKDQVKFIGLLKTGQAIVRCKERFPFPFLVTVPFTKSPLHVTDEEIRSHMNDYFQLSKQLDRGFNRCPPLPSIPSTEYTPPTGAKILLQEIVRQPFIGTDERYKLLGLHSRQGNTFKNDLVENGFVIPVQVDRKVLLELTPLGREYLKSIKFKIPRQARGSIAHNYYLEEIKEYFKSKEGFPYKEKDDIDLVVQTYHSEYYIQIETGKSNIKKNIETLLKQKSDNLLMIATNKDAEVKIRNILSSVTIPGKEKVQVWFIKDFLSSNPIAHSHPN